MAYKTVRCNKTGCGILLEGFGKTNAEAYSDLDINSLKHIKNWHSGTYHKVKKQGSYQDTGVWETKPLPEWF